MFNMILSGTYNFLKKESKLLCISAAVGIIFAITTAAYTYVYSSTTQADIADNVIRFHVQANSDSVADQYVKEHIRVAVLNAFEDYLSGSNDIDETRATLTANLPQMEQIATEILHEQGFSYAATANLTITFFPTRFYGNMSFPPGMYEAVQIKLGEGTGSNWWCLMFPPLCYVDMTGTDEGQALLEETISEEGFRLLMHQEENSQTLQVRFRVVEWWQNRHEPMIAGELAHNPNIEHEAYTNTP